MVAAVVATRLKARDEAHRAAAAAVIADRYFDRCPLARSMTVPDRMQDGA